MSTTNQRDEIKERAQSVFREVFEDPALVISETTTAEDIADWDSLAHINLIIALEKAFKIQFTSEQVTSMAEVGDLFKLLEEKTEVK